MMLCTFLIVCFVGSCVGFDDWDEFEMVWNDEFDTLDLTKWQHEVTAWGGGNNEFQVYTQDPENSYVQDGKLFIKATLLAENTNPSTGQPFGQDFMQFGTLDLTSLYGVCTNADNNGCFRTGAAGNIPPTMSGRLRTWERFSFKYGRAVISAKMPVGDWLWPAIWMLAEDNVYGGWPRSGEMDIIEAIGNRDYATQSGELIGIQKTGSTMHWGPAWDDNHYWLTHQTRNENDNNYGDNFHTFILDWNENGIRFFVDDEDNALLTIPNPLIDQNPSWVDFWTFGAPWNPANTNPWTDGTNMAPFDEAFHFILNVAVGTNNGFIPDNCINRGGDPAYVKPWLNSQSYITAMQNFYNARGNWQWTWDIEEDNSAMQVDYVRVYQRI